MTAIIRISMGFILLTTQSVFRSDLLILFNDHCRENGGNACYDGPANDGHPSSAEAAAGEQRTEEEYQEADSKANSKL